MKLFAFLILVLSVSFQSLAAEGGSSVGNGGGGVLCEGERLEQLDTYEARELYGYLESWHLGAASLDDEFDSYLFGIRTALPVGHPFIMDLIQNFYILKSTVQLVNEPLFMTDDIGFFQLAKGCVFQQIAERGTGILAGKLVVDRKYWLDSTYSQQALLLIHEAAHTWFSEYAFSPQSNLAIRQLIAFLYSDAYMDAHKRELMKRLIDTRAPLSLEEMKSK